MENFTSDKKISNLDFYSALSVLMNGMWLQSDIEEFLKEYQISHGQYSILLSIFGAKETFITASEIANELGKSKPTIAKMIKKLIEQGFISYQTFPVDNRKKKLILLEKALQLIEAINPEYQHKIFQFMSNISDQEKAILITILNKLNIREGKSYQIMQNVLPNAEKCSIIKQLCKSGSLYDVDCVLGFLDEMVDIPTTKFVDFYLGTLTNPEGIKRIESYLFNGTQIQRNYCTLFFLRRNEWEVVNKAYTLGLIDYKQAYSR
jgi:DNA-binding MarR family transcriptional regulator